MSKLPPTEPILDTFTRELAKEDVCPRCLGELDTGWECTRCGYDAIHLSQEGKGGTE